MRFSHRTHGLDQESEWSAAVRAARLRPGLLDLTETNPTRCNFSFYERLLGALADSRNLRYEPDPQGSLDARQAVTRYYRQRGVELTSDRLVLTAGTSEAYSFLLKLLLEPGQALMVPEPGYPLLDHLARLSDAELVRYPLVYEPGGWRMDRERLLERWTPAVKAVVAVHPNNPTGHWTPTADRDWLCAQAASRGAAVISDEVFLDFSWDAARSEGSFAQEAGALTFTLSGISKVLALPQMKLSWIAVSGPPSVVCQALERLSVLADAFLSVSAPSQHALARWLTSETIAQVQGELLTRLRGNHQMLGRLLGSGPLKLLKADAGWQAVLRWDGGRTDVAFAAAALERAVLVQPGYLFDLPEHHAVISLLPGADVFAEGVRRLTDLV